VARYDSRLADLHLLALAAMRARARRRTQPEPSRVVVLKILYDGTPEEPPLEGATHVLYLPEKALSAEAWYHCPLSGSVASRSLRRERRHDPAPDEGVGLPHAGMDQLGA
jgi:hypothetical protein